MRNENKKVQIIYCKCGESVCTAIALDVVRTPHEKAAITKEVNLAKKFDIKTEIVTFEEYRKIPFMSCKCFTNKKNHTNEKKLHSHRQRSRFIAQRAADGNYCTDEGAA